MKSNWIQKYQMLERVYNLCLAHLNDFPKVSAAPSIIKALGLRVAKLKNHASQQVSGAGAIQQSGSSHQEARKALKTSLDLIFQTARALNLEQFYLPRQRTDAAYIATGQSFAELAQPFEAKFVEQGLPPNFIVALGAAVADLQRSVIAKMSSKGAHSGSIAEFNETLKQAMVDLKRLDALVKNTIASDPGFLAAWKIARRVTHTGAASKTTTASAPPTAEAAMAAKTS
jgi:hypothetical protein